jgi:hypothetical protein
MNPIKLKSISFFYSQKKIRIHAQSFKTWINIKCELTNFKQLLQTPNYLLFIKNDHMWRPTKSFIYPF